MSGRFGAGGHMGAQVKLEGKDGAPLPLADTVDCKIELRRLFMAEALRLSQGKPPVAGGCPGACPAP